MVLIHELDREIETRTNGDADIDNVVRALISLREVSLDDLRDAAEHVLGAPARALQSPLLAEKH